MNVTLGSGCGSGDCDGGWNVAGGLVGTNPGTILNSKASGTVVVGSNAFAGGLVGSNQNWDSSNNPISGARIINSFASGSVSSAGMNVALGGLVGNNAPLSRITGSGATGAVTSTPTVPPGCLTGGSCPNGSISAGGLVGQNSGSVRYSSASGEVTVGWFASAGGLVGSNQFWTQGETTFAGSVSRSFASGAVTATGWDNNLGGLVGTNGPLSRITRSKASGSVTATADVPDGLSTCSDGGCLYNNSGGLVGQNAGIIRYSRATGDVTVSWFASAGGLVGSNQSWTQGETTFAGMVSYSSASGAVTATGWDNSLGGLVGTNGPLSRITRSKASGSVTATADVPDGLSTCSDGGCPYNNSGGLVGQNAGIIRYSRATGDVTVSWFASAGGLVGSNQSWTQGETTFAGIVTRSFASGSVTATGWDNNLGGLVGSSDAGSRITGSSATGAVTATAAVPESVAQSCSGAGPCLFNNAGGLVGKMRGLSHGRALPVSSSSDRTRRRVGWSAAIRIGIRTIRQPER